MTRDLCKKLVAHDLDYLIDLRANYQVEYDKLADKYEKIDISSVSDGDEWRKFIELQKQYHQAKFDLMVLNAIIWSKTPRETLNLRAKSTDELLKMYKKKHKDLNNIKDLSDDAQLMNGVDNRTTLDFIIGQESALETDLNMIKEEIVYRAKQYKVEQN